MEAGSIQVSCLVTGTLMKFEPRDRIVKIYIPADPIYKTEERVLSVSYKVFQVFRTCLERFPVVAHSSASAMDPLMYDLVVSIQELQEGLHTPNQNFIDMLNKVIGVVGIWYGKLCGFVRNVGNAKLWVQTKLHEVMRYGDRLSSNGYLRELQALTREVGNSLIIQETISPEISQEGYGRLAAQKKDLQKRIVAILEGISELSQTDGGSTG